MRRLRGKQLRRFGILPIDGMQLYSLDVLILYADNNIFVVRRPCEIFDRQAGVGQQDFKFAGRHFNHAQFSPTDPELFCLSQDWFYDKVSGRRFMFDHRTWLMNRSNSMFRSITPDYQPPGHEDCHEWWSQDGMLCYQNYAAGAYEVNVYTNERVHVWQRPVCHAHCSPDRRYWTADQTPYRWAETGCPVLFFDRVTGKEQQIISSQQPPIYPRSDYHTDPHPHFSPRGDLVICTTTVLGGLDVALTPTAPLG